MEYVLIIVMGCYATSNFCAVEHVDFNSRFACKRAEERWNADPGKSRPGLVKCVSKGAEDDDYPSVVDEAKESPALVEAWKKCSSRNGSLMMDFASKAWSCMDDRDGGAYIRNPDDELLIGPDGRGK